jgi:hypothetical protein
VISEAKSSMRITVKPGPGTHIINAAALATWVAETLGIPVRLDFNDKIVDVRPGDFAADVADRYWHGRPTND